MKKQALIPVFCMLMDTTLGLSLLQVGNRQQLCSWQLAFGVVGCCLVVVLRKASYKMALFITTSRQTGGSVFKSSCGRLKPCWGLDGYVFAALHGDERWRVKPAMTRHTACRQR